MRILMVCLGNICRSPLAEGIMRAKVQERGLEWTIDSAGTGDWHEGNAPDNRAVAVAAKNGIDITQQKARKFDKEDFDNYDLILPMDTVNRDDLYELSSTMDKRDKIRLIMDVVYPNKNISVPDPYYGGDSGFDKVFDMLNEACEKVIDIYIK